jgi:hypothetical protein
MQRPILRSCMDWFRLPSCFEGNEAKDNWHCYRRGSHGDLLLRLVSWGQGKCTLVLFHLRSWFCAADPVIGSSNFDGFMFEFGYFPSPYHAGRVWGPPRLCIGTPGGVLEDSDRGVMLNIYLCLVLRSTIVELYFYISTPPHDLMQLYRPLCEKCLLEISTGLCQILCRQNVSQLDL